MGTVFRYTNTLFWYLYTLFKNFRDSDKMLEQGVCFLDIAETDHEWCFFKFITPQRIQEGTPGEVLLPGTSRTVYTLKVDPKLNTQGLDKWIFQFKIHIIYSYMHPWYTKFISMEICGH